MLIAEINNNPPTAIKTVPREPIVSLSGVLKNDAECNNYDANIHDPFIAFPFPFNLIIVVVNPF
jgi:hypothetical protein